MLLIAGSINGTCECVLVHITLRLNGIGSIPDQSTRYMCPVAKTKGKYGANNFSKNMCIAQQKDSHLCDNAWVETMGTGRYFVNIHIVCVFYEIRPISDGNFMKNWKICKLRLDCAKYVPRHRLCSISGGITVKRKLLTLTTKYFFAILLFGPKT